MIWRFRFQRRSETKALAQYWDALLHRAPVETLTNEPVEESLRDAIRTFHRLNEAEGERFPFEEELLQRIEAQRKEYLTMSVVAAPIPNSLPDRHPQRGPESPAQIRPSVRDGSVRWRPWDMGRGRTRLVWSAALLIVVLLVVAFVGRFGNDDQRGPAIVAPDIASPTAVTANPTATAAAEIVSYLGRDVPSPEECTVEPYSGVPEITNPRQWPDPGTYAFAAPDGTSADAETVAAVTEVVRGEMACFNAGDILRVFTYWTDQLVINSFGTEQMELLQNGATYDVSRDKIIENGTVTPLPEADWTDLIAVLDVEVLEPGWVGAYVVFDPAGVVPAEISYVFFQQTERGWLIDGSLCYNVQGTEGC